MSSPHPTGQGVEEPCALSGGPALSRLIHHHPDKISPHTAPPDTTHLLIDLLQQTSVNQNKEANLIDTFLAQNAQKYSFEHKNCKHIFRLIVQNRFLKNQHIVATNNAGPQNSITDAASPAQVSAPNTSDAVTIKDDSTMVRILQTMRVLMRDKAHREEFVKLKALKALAHFCNNLANQHFARGGITFASDMLVETLSILKRFANNTDLQLIEPQPNELHVALVALLSSRDALVLQCVLVALCQFVHVEYHMLSIGQLACAEILLRIIADYEPSFKVLAAEVLEKLLRHDSFAQDVALHDGVALLLSLLHSYDEQLSLPLIRSVRRLVTRDSESTKQVRALGGVNVIVSVLAPAAANDSGFVVSQPLPFAIIREACIVLTELSLNQDAALQVRKDP